jgi:hypothetical protein
VVAAVVATFLGTAVPSAAQPTPGPTPTASAAPVEVPEAVPGEEQCTSDDYRLQALSGMVAHDDGYVVVNDGNSRNIGFDAMAVLFLDQGCQIVDHIPLPDQRDPEDLAYDREGDVLWVADTGDNFEVTGFEERPNVALWRIDLADRNPVIYRFDYRDGAKDAEALVLDGDGTPIIVTRALSGEPAGLYRPAGELVPSQGPEDTVPLERVGEFSPPDTGAEHSMGRIARRVITGGANSPDGSRVALRTYTDAFEFDVSDGDVVAAITSQEPRITPLPDEPWGESITYTTDGEHFLTVSDTYEFEGVSPVILRYPPTEPTPEPSPTGGPAAGAPAQDNRSLLDRLGPQGLLNIVAAVGVIGLLMVAVGVFGIVRARRQVSLEADGGGDPDEAGAPAAARARVAPAPPEPQPGWEPQPGPEQVPDGHAESYPPPAGGTVYSAGAGTYAAGAVYQEQPFDQEYPDGYQHGGYAGQQPGGHPDQPAADPAGGTYSGGVYQSRQDEVPDYYSDDPDYPYEFRDRDRW